MKVMRIAATNAECNACLFRIMYVFDNFNTNFIQKKGGLLLLFLDKEILTWCSLSSEQV